MVNRNIAIEHAQICFTNFSGTPNPPYNTLGRRRFCVLLDEPMAEEMSEEGWNVRYLSPKDPNFGEEPRPYVQVEVRFDRYPPKIVLCTAHGKTVLTEEEVSILDWAEIENIDLILRPYNWSMGSGREGVKAMLKSMYVTLAEDEFTAKYSDIPSSDLTDLIDR